MILGCVVDTTRPHRITEQVVAAERAGLNFVLFEDGPGPDPIECAAFASASTRAIGLLATASATHAEPFHLANRFAGLDWGSSGRAGWLVTVDASAARARAYSAAPPEAAAAVAEADAVVDAARRLWDSWEDGALIADSARGRFLDATKLHYVDAGEPLFRIRGPALMPRPPQGQVVVVGRSDDGIGDVDVVLRTVEPGADLLARLRGLDGVVLTDFVPDVLPALIAEGLVIPPRPGQTLRDQLGLPRPASRYAVEAR